MGELAWGLEKEPTSSSTCQLVKISEPNVKHKQRRVNKFGKTLHIQPSTLRYGWLETTQFSNDESRVVEKAACF